MAGGHEHMPGAVIFFVGPRLLVLTNLAGSVLLCFYTGDDACLGHAFADLPIEVEARPSFFCERPVSNHCLQIVARLLVDLCGMAICFGGQVNLGTDDMQERARLALCTLAGLFGGDHVVGIAGDFGSMFG